MRIENYRQEQHEMLSKWWNGHDWTEIPQSALPELGWIVRNDEKMLCAGFLYRDVSCSLAQMEWVVTNPENSARESLKSISLLMDYITSYASRNGLSLFTSVENKGLIKIYQKFGFNVSETSMTNMLRV